MERENTGAVVVWFFGGALLGATVALLLAPQSGKRTRRLLGEKAEEGRKSLFESGQDIVSRGRELYERGREIAEETAELFERGRRVAEKSIEDRL
jgi:gas vesicle protein